MLYFVVALCRIFWTFAIFDSFYTFCYVRNHKQEIEDICAQYIYNKFVYLNLSIVIVHTCLAHLLLYTCVSYAILKKQCCLTAQSITYL